MICFVGGASGSGKTACMQYLKNKHPSWKVFDFDEVGVPQDADSAWRQQTTNQWIERAITLQFDTHPVCIFGQTVLSEILAIS